MKNHHLMICTMILTSDTFDDQILSLETAKPSHLNLLAGKVPYIHVRRLYAKPSHLNLLAGKVPCIHVRRLYVGGARIMELKGK